VVTNLGSFEAVTALEKSLQFSNAQRKNTVATYCSIHKQDEGPLWVADAAGIPAVPQKAMIDFPAHRQRLQTAHTDCVQSPITLV